jgi:very-short-patch-repair endonuclease
MKNGGSAYINSFNEKGNSKPQQKLFKMVKELYKDAKSNFPFLNYNLDIIIPSLRLVIEYDGAYWHQNPDYDKKRQNEVESWDWKFIRYRGTMTSDPIPTIDQLKNDIELICKEF